MDGTKGVADMSYLLENPLLADLLIWRFFDKSALALAVG